MKQPRLLLALVLTINCTSFAMKKDVPETSATSMEAFKAEVRTLNLREFVLLGRGLDFYKDTYFYGLLHLKNGGFNEVLCERLADEAKLDQTYKISGPIYQLLKKFGFPVSHFNEESPDFVPKETSCLHPIIMSKFSATFQELIKQKKNKIIQEKIDKSENIESWTSKQKRLFGISLFNSAINELTAEIILLNRKTSAHFTAFLEIKAEKGLGDRSLLELSEIVKKLEKNSMDFSNVEIVKIKNVTVIRRRTPQSDPEISTIIDEALEKFKMDAE